MGKVIVENRVNEVLMRLAVAVHPVMDKVASDGVEMCQDMMTSRGRFVNDTGAVSASFYATGSNGLRTLEPGSLSLFGPMQKGRKYRFSDKAPKHLSKEHRENYTQAEEQTIAPFRLPKSPAHIYSATSSQSKVVFWWEYGHNNRFTGKFEMVTTLRPLANREAHRMAARFYNILHRAPGAAAATETFGGL